MSVAYRAVGWSRFKLCYDLVLAGVVVGFLAAFVGVSLAVFPDATVEIMLIRAFGTAAFLLLHVVLCIGPLARHSPLFLPLVYNRRHLGVATFLTGALHALLVIGTYHAGSEMNPFVSVFVSDTGLTASAFPFQLFGFLALVILFLMAATSHDFWLATFSAPVWKALHMSVYVAYVLLIGHVVFGVLQSETHPALAVGTALGLVLVFGLHISAARREAIADRTPVGESADDAYVRVCAVDEIPESKAVAVFLSGERIAVFRYGDRISALSSVCQHQNGPLGEGRVIDGCVTCPWHGYQYNPETGESPPPFTEKVPVFQVRVSDGGVWVNPTPLAPGTRVEPAMANRVNEP